jgi:putative transposase
MASFRVPFLPATFYHLYNHGNGNDDIFRNRGNYLYFLSKYASYLNPIVDTYAYCLMPNHFHFLIQIHPEETLITFFSEWKKQRMLEKMTLAQRELVQDTLVVEIKKETLPNLIAQHISHFLNGYTQGFNKQQQRKGSLFLDNIQRKPVENEAYFTNLIHYIHSNPVHHGFTKEIEDWEFSSFHAFLSEHKTSLQRQKVLSWFGQLAGFRAVHDQPPQKIDAKLDF